MRRTFATELYKHMLTDKDIILICGDVGYGMFDRIRDEMPDRFINTGAAEQAMMGMAVGMALEGKKVFVYTITPFLLYRPFETIRNYINHERIPVKLIGSGRNRDYAHDGFSHWAEEDRNIMKLFSNITSMYPESKDEITELLNQMLTINEPFYLNLKR